MASLSSLYAALNQCIQFQNTLNQAKSILATAPNTLEKACNIEPYFAINESPADNKDIEKQKTKIQGAVSSLGSASSQVSARIEQIRAEIRAEEERIRAAEEAARRAHHHTGE